MPSPPYLKGRGAQINTANRFDKHIGEQNPLAFTDDDVNQIPTQYINVAARSIINKVDSPDIPMPYSMNPYQGCEHGCIYCYARNTHNYWGYSAGVEFEQKILIKEEAPQLLAKQLRSKNWKAAPIMLSGNTDCYQPIERKLEITRKLLEVCWRFRHPVGVITKNSLVLRDLDLLSKLNEHNLVRVAISLTTLNEQLRQFMEPRTATVAGRLETIRQLSAAGIPVNLMMAPIIPSLTDHEIFDLLKAAAEAGARSANYTMVRLNGDIAILFEDWLRKNYPDRADKVLNKIKDCHGGALSDNRFGKRMSGEGHIAAIISKQFKLARKRFFSTEKLPPLNTELYYQMKAPQMKLF
ncbi:MAG: PA0069 family radical SAM protein [Bacteroidota bacterium]